MGTYTILNYDYYKTSHGLIWFCILRDINGKKRYIKLNSLHIMPCFYILKKDRDLVSKILKEHYASKYIIDYLVTHMKTYMDEDIIKFTFETQYQLSKVRNILKKEGILTFNADIKWDEYVSQELKLRQFINIPDKMSFLSPSDFRKTKKSFPLKQNICYWDIETDTSKVPSLRQVWKYPDAFTIISYVTYNSFINTYIYYGWKEEWEPETYTEKHDSVMKKVLNYIDAIDEVEMKTERGKAILNKIRDSLPNIKNHPMFKRYPMESKVIVKKFNNETDMHMEFIDDFDTAQYDGIMTFNGRGGNVIAKGDGASRRWNDGFDMPAFYARCKYLGLLDYIQKMSPMPQSYGTSKNVFVKMSRGEKGVEKYLPTIKCVPQHDLYYDNTVMFYTKDEEKMKDKKLDTYMKHFLGIGKIPHEDMVWDLFKKDWKKEKLYNIVDVEGMFALDRYFNYTNDVALRALLYGAKIEDGVYASKLHDHINLWYASGEYVMDTRGNFRPENWNGLIDKKFGGYNLAIPDPLLLGYPKEEFGFIIDFSKLYPSCIMTCNADKRTKINFKAFQWGLSPLDAEDLILTGKSLEDYEKVKYIIDTQDKCYLYSEVARSPAGYFRKDIEAQSVTIYNDFKKQRKKYQDLAEGHLDQYGKTGNPFHKNQAMHFDKIQRGYKALVNGKYGAEGMGSETSKFKPRNYDLVLYNTGPATGQDIIKHLLFVLLPKYDYKPFFASTDSAMLKAKSNTAMDTWDEAQELLRKINKDLDDFVQENYNPIKNYISLGCEKVFDQCLLFNKRMYMLNTVIEDSNSGPILLKKKKVYIRGLEFLRNNSSMQTTELQYKLLDMVRNRKETEEIKQWLEKQDEIFHKKKWNYICGRASISKNPEESKSKHQNYTATGNSNKFMGKDYKAGDRPFLGLFKTVPSYYKGVSKDVLYTNKEGNIPLAFEITDIKKMKKAGFELNYIKHKKMQIINKIDRILLLVWKKNYDEMLEDEADPVEI